MADAARRNEAEVRAEIEESERLGPDVPDDAPPPKRLHKRPGTPVAIRMQDYLIDEIKEVADELDIPATTLMRGWIMAGLRQHQDEGTVGAAIEPADNAADDAPELTPAQRAALDRLPRLTDAQRRKIIAILTR